jgi:hypothetical protein
MFKMDVLVIFLQPRIHGTACLPNVDLATPTGDSVVSMAIWLYICRNNTGTSGQILGKFFTAENLRFQFHIGEIILIITIHGDKLAFSLCLVERNLINIYQSKKCMERML